MFEDDDFKDPHASPSLTRVVHKTIRKLPSDGLDAALHLHVPDDSDDSEDYSSIQEPSLKDIMNGIMSIKKKTKKTNKAVQILKVQTKEVGQATLKNTQAVQEVKNEMQSMKSIQNEFDNRIKALENDLKSRNNSKGQGKGKSTSDNAFAQIVYGARKYETRLSGYPRWTSTQTLIDGIKNAFSLQGVDIDIPSLPQLYPKFLVAPVNSS